MKRILRRLGALFLTALLLAGVLAPAAGAREDAARALTILFTHDTHDHFLPAPAEDGGEYGGYTRLATLLCQEREVAEHPVVTLDAGDFSMGSLFQTIYSSDAPELRALGAMGYDVSTLGNHEFDYRSAGLAAMLNAAVDSGERLPALVQANYKPPAEDTAAWAAWRRYGVGDYTVLERGGLRVAVFGVLGVDADECAPMSGMEFTPIADAARQVVAEIRANENPDYIICLSHSGTSDGKGEDYELARAVDGIDVIISGHTHSTTPTPIQVNGTLIVSCGEYTQNLGVLTVEKSGNQTVESDFRLIPVDGSVPDDPAMTALAAEFQNQVEQQYLADYGLMFHQVLATSSFDFTPISQFAAQQQEDPLGSLIADSYVYAVQQAEGEAYVPVDFAVVASGVVRASLTRGDITTSDAFNVSSLGSGGDGTPGYPLISVWITGRELRDAFEVDASVTPIMSAAQLYPSGMTWTWNPHRMIFNRVTQCAQVLPDGKQVPLEDDKLYRVVTGLYSGQMLGAVNGKSFGILTITPKDAQGRVVTDFEEQIIHNQNGSEVKEWYALASYLQSMGAVDARYAAPEGRKVCAPSWNPIRLLEHPNWITLLVVLAAALLIVLAALLARRLIGGGGRRRYGVRRGGRSAYRRYRG